MAQTKIPNSLERRHLVERELSPRHALAVAEAYLQEGRLEEAAVFLGKAGSEERLESLAREAVETGDAFLLSEISRVQGREPPAQTWQQLAESARRAGKELYAETAERQAHRSND